MIQICSRFTKPEDMGTLESANVDTLIYNAFRYFSKFSEVIPTAKLAISLLKLLNGFVRLCSSKQRITQKFGSLAEKFISFEWEDCREIKSDQLTYLLQLHISKSPEPIETIQKYAQTAFMALVSSDADSLEKYPLLNKESFQVYFKVVFAELNELVKTYAWKTTAAADVEDQLLFVDKSVTCFLKLVEFAKVFEKRTILAGILKNSKLFLDVFIKKMLPLMSKNFKAHQDAVTCIVKYLQNGTRILQV